MREVPVVKLVDLSQQVLQIVTVSLLFGKTPVKHFRYMGLTVGPFLVLYVAYTQPGKGCAQGML
jgi:hypothetical protein